MQAETVDELETLAGALDEALLRLGESDTTTKAAALALKDAVEEFYKAGVKRLVRCLLDEIPNGAETLRELAGDPVVRAMFLSTGVLRVGPSERAHRALESIRPYLNSHGGDVEFVRVEPPVAFVRLIGACSGCSMSSVGLADEVRTALVYAVEEITEIEVIADEPVPALVHLGTTRRSNVGWHDGPELASIARFVVHPFMVEGHSLVITSVDGRLACFRNECGHMGMEIDRATIDGDGILTCPWHGFRYDATTGECISAPGVGLEQFPIRVQDGRLSVKLEQ
ncbi:MAG: NifU family protein [Ferrimicrobium sp.]